jgi:hypothetical protein
MTAGNVVPVRSRSFVQADHAAFPQVAEGPAGVFPHPRIVHIIAQNDELADDLVSFADELIGGSWWSIVGVEYGVGTAESLRVIGPAIVANPTRSDMERYILNVIAAHPVFAPDGSSIYMLYLPNGIVALEDAFDPPRPNNYCSFYSGYHLPLGHGPDNWAVAQRCSLLGSHQQQLDSLTETASHEIIESATDPVAGFQIPITSTTTPWIDDIWAWSYAGTVEVADLCGDASIRQGRFLLQRSWSNQAARGAGDPCVPAVATPYFNASAPEGWYPIAAAATIDVPITGWSTTSIDDWLVEVRLMNGWRGFDASLTSATSTTTMSGAFSMTLNNGRVATLHVTAPKEAVAGRTYVVASIMSRALVSNGDPPHSWPIGFYVPAN